LLLLSAQHILLEGFFNDFSLCAFAAEEKGIPDQVRVDLNIGRHVHRIAQVPAQRKQSSQEEKQGSPAEKHFKQKKEKRICTEGHEGHKEMGREHGRAKVRSCVVISAALEAVLAAGR
jgi:hypothetical protein